MPRPDPAGIHEPVLLQEVLKLLAPRPGERAVDGTLGSGGHSRKLLQATAPDGPYLGLDRDPDALARCADLPGAFGERVTLRQARFSSLEALLDAGHAALPTDLLLADLGLSSDQLADRERGFSFREAGPLDMRMGADGPALAEKLAQATADELAGVLRDLGEERYYRRIAEAILEALNRGKLETTADLTDTVAHAMPRPKGAKGKGGRRLRSADVGRIHPATRTFQALRIWVNDELGELDALLAGFPRLLAPGGRAAIISFHSLEDRRVKNAFRDLKQRAGWHVLTKKPVTATPEESRRNPRSRSAKLRVIQRPTQGEE